MTKRFASNFRGFAFAALTFTCVVTAAFAGTGTTGTAAAQGPQQVVVTNTPAQPVPMVGLVKDSDAPARKPFQSNFILVSSNVVASVVSVPANQRLVVEHVSALCSGVLTGNVRLLSVDPSTNFSKGQEFLPGEVLYEAISTPVRFYADPGLDLKLYVFNTGGKGETVLSR